MPALSFPRLTTITKPHVACDLPCASAYIKLAAIFFACEHARLRNGTFACTCMCASLCVHANRCACRLFCARRARRRAATCAQAGHRATTISHNDYLENTPADNLSAFVQFEDWDITRNVHDVLHMIHLGLGKDFAGSCLLELAAEGLFGGDGIEEQLKYAWAGALKFHWRSCCAARLVSSRGACRCLQRLDRAACTARKANRSQVAFRRWASANSFNCKVPVFDLNSLQLRSLNQDYPILHSGIKGFATKVILHWLAAATWESTRAAGCNDHARLRAACAYSMAEFLHTLDKGDVWLSPEEAANAYCFGRHFLLTYSTLAWQAFSQGVLRWKLRPKFHSMDHALHSILSTCENIKAHANWLEEDLMGRVGRIAGRTHRSTMPRRVLQRYRLKLALMWHKRRTQPQRPGGRGPGRGQRPAARQT